MLGFTTRDLLQMIQEVEVECKDLWENGKNNHDRKYGAIGWQTIQKIKRKIKKRVEKKAKP